MRLIDADALKELIYKSWGGDPAYHTARYGELKTETESKAEYACLMLEDIDAQPTIEAEPIVRCKDCKLRDVFGECVAYEAFWSLGDDGFCSLGERKDEVKE